MFSHLFCVQFCLFFACCVLFFMSYEDFHSISLSFTLLLLFLFLLLVLLFLPLSLYGIVNNFICYTYDPLSGAASLHARSQRLPCLVTASPVLFVLSTPPFFGFLYLFFCLLCSVLYLPQRCLQYLLGHLFIYCRCRKVNFHCISPLYCSIIIIIALVLF